MRHKAQVALGIFAANLLLSLGDALLTGIYSNSLPSVVFETIYLALAGGLFFAKRGVQSLTILALMLLVFCMCRRQPHKHWDNR